MLKTLHLCLVASLALLGAAAGTANADPVDGRIIQDDKVKANHTDVWTIQLEGEEVTRIRVQGDGDTCLELRIYDASGHLVAAHVRGLGDKREVYITPPRTQEYKIHIKNLGNVFNRYTMIAD